MFLSDDGNTAVFPLPNGDFPLEEMITRTHFEVNGDGIGPMPPVSQSPVDNGPPPSAPARAGGRFLFSARQATAPTSGAMPQFRRPLTRRFAR